MWVSLDVGNPVVYVGEFRCVVCVLIGFGCVYWGLTPQQQPGSYQGGEMMMKSVFWWRKPEYPEETTDLRQVTGDTFIGRYRSIHSLEGSVPWWYTLILTCCHLKYYGFYP